MTKNIFKRVLSVLVAVILVVGMFPIFAAADEQDNRVVDISTMDNWKTFFGSDIKSTENAGGVWSDKSVFTNTDAFPSSVKMLDDKNNLLVALSAIASNKEIVGYATIPTDTMLVLDISGSMSNDADELVIAANQAIEALLNTNNNNRVGVVLYSGNSSTGASTYAQGTTVLLPIDRYTTTSSTTVNLGTNNRPNRVQIKEYIELDGGEVSINSTVRNSSNRAPASASKDVEGGTYIQSGLFAALREFEKVDTTVDGNFQDGQKRKPILVLMSDGDPTTATSRFAAVNEVYKKQVNNPNFNDRRPESATNPRYLYVDTTESDAGRGTATSTAMGFLTQLTASYVRNRIEHLYDCEGESLFYTLGLGVDGGNNSVTVAETVLDTTQTTTALDGYWDTYLGLADSVSMELTVPSTTNNQTKEVAVYKNSNAVDRHYVTEYFEADSSSEMISAFEKIVQEIIIQSRYYATRLDGGNPDFSGYMTFEDDLGEYMEVKDIKGILLGDTLFSGAALTSKINSNADGLGTVENPTELGHEFIRSIMQRVGITDQKEAQNLAIQAWEHGQLAYSNEGGVETFSNYIGWYAKADGSYAGFWHEGVTTPPADAVYTNKSYGLLGQADGNIRDSDMMFMSIQVHTDIYTGRQSVIWKIPAALMPMVTYKVTLQGSSVETATDVSLEIVDAQPVRLLFEVGLKKEINELSVGRITDPKFIDGDGVTRRFWSNYWNKNNSNDPNAYESTESYFKPSEQNERYFYTENATIYTKSGNTYTAVTDFNHSFDGGGEYYHARWIFTTADHPVRLYELISAESLEKRVYEDDEWIIPLGTVCRYYTPYQLTKTENKTESIEYRNYPHIIPHEDHLDVDSMLGNNGMLRVTPAQGIKLSKTVDIAVPGAAERFNFRITLNPPSGAILEDEYPITIAALDEVVGEKSTVEVNNNVIELDVSANQSVYITGLPSGTEYTVQELEENGDYKVKSVHINGVAIPGAVAAGRITAFVIDEVDFLNTPLSEGELVISKSVNHPFEAGYVIPDNISFTARVTLTNSRSSVANQTYTLITAAGRSNITTDARGQFTVTLKAGETVAVEGIPELTDYTVEELNMPSGFTLDTRSSANLTGRILADANIHAQLVNSYQPASVSPDVDIIITKLLNGRDWNNDSFTFVVNRIDMLSRATYVEIARGSISADGQRLETTLNNEVYTEPGTYHYVITEVKGADGNGITYDAVERRFHVEVDDADMDGQLEISSVDNVTATTVSGNATEGWTVSSEFTNSYAPIHGSTVEIAVDKRMSGNSFALNGFKFALYDETDTNLIVESTLTDSNGRATFRIAYPADHAGTTVKYVLREVYTGVSGMTYDSATYNVTVRIVDNGDGTTSAYSSITPADSDSAVAVPTFTNTYAPENGELIIAGKKSLNGRVQNAGEFSFNLYKLDAPNADIADGELVDTTVNTANGDFIFDLITFDSADDYYFAVTEVKGNSGGVTYDETVHRITVRVTDLGGVLEANIVSAPQGGINFVNTYTVEKLSVPLSGIKHLSGKAIEDGEFTFELKDSSGATLQSKTNAGNRFTFDALEFTEAGEYTYTVTEVDEGDAGITYDKSVYTVKMVVIDGGEGKLLHTVTMDKNGFEVTGISFSNSYLASPVPLNVSGDKELTGRNTALEAGEFTFELYNVNTADWVSTATNDAGGHFDFEPVILHTAGTYHFIVTEHNDRQAGINYDHSAYELTVVVVDNLDGQLVIDSARSTLTKNGVAVDGIKFENSYKAAPTGLVLEGTKNLTGRDLEDGEFTFVLKDSSGATLQTKTNDGNTVTFDEIIFDQADVYTYTVVEDDSAKAAGIDYDPTVYEVTVTVTDNNVGSLVADTKIKVVGGDESDIVFNNVFTPADLQIKLNIKKLLENKTTETIGLDGFKFKVVGEGIDETLTSDENGNAELTLTLTADQIGDTLTFKITELDTDIEYMVYDTTEHTVTVTVGVDNKGVLSAELTQNSSATDEVTVQFTNTYNGKPEPEAPKTGDYRNMWMWAALLFVSGGMMTATTLLGKKQDKAK